MTPLLQASRLVCGYGNTPITEAIDMEVREGEVVALIGPNGSGKSTLLKTLAGYLVPVAGHVRVGDKVLRSMPEHELAKLVAVVPQDEAQPFRFSVRQIVAMGRLAKSGSFFETKEDDAAISAALEQADCRFLAERSITEVSGGERQRTLIARALAQETPLLVMDEPTSHLDVSHVAEFVRLIKTLANCGKGIVLAVHDINVALAGADKILLLKEGKKRFEGSPQALIQSKEAEAVYGIRFHVHETAGIFSVAAMLR